MDEFQTLVTDDDGTVYMIHYYARTVNGDSFSILMRDDRGGWDRVFGGFGVRRHNGVTDPKSLIFDKQHEERQEAEERIARLYLKLPAE